VGRYFSGHFSFVANSSLALSQRPSSLALYKGRGRQAVLGHWAMHKAVQSEFGLPNFGVGLYSNRRALSRLDRDVALAAAVTDAGLRSPPPDQHSVTERSSPLYFLIEQVLNPESRITLSSAKDALGMPKVTLVWRFLPRDFDGLREGVGLFARELGRTSQGRVRTMVQDVNFVQHFRLARHHIGATRMHSNPKRGVVNPDCRVHSLGNLYIAGSSVFPTPGVVNPTLTILALALRLADHLKIRLKKGT
jgi:choline dehydrogenase-like flavoprotein